MTLLLGTVNPLVAVLMADRRFTSIEQPTKTVGDGLTAPDDSNKTTVFVCRNARLALAFTGLAWAPWTGPDEEIGDDVYYLSDVLRRFLIEHVDLGVPEQLRPRWITTQTLGGGTASSWQFPTLPDEAETLRQLIRSVRLNCRCAHGDRRPVVCSQAKGAERGRRAKFSDGRFRTQDWLVEALFESQKADDGVAAAFERLRASANTTFRSVRGNLTDKRLTVLGIGFFYDSANEPHAMFAALTNDPTQQVYAFAESALPGEFVVVMKNLISVSDFGASFAVEAGRTAAVDQHDVVGLADMARANTPWRQMVNRAVGLIQGAASSAAASGLIGTQCSSLILESDPSAEPRWGYHTGRLTTSILSPSFVTPAGITLLSMIEPLENGVPVVAAVQRTGLNKPCPCGSGKKFRNCHRTV